MTNENNPTGENDSSDDEEFSSGGSSNDLNLDLDSDRGRQEIRRAQNQHFNRKVVEAHDTRYNGPDIAYQIPERLYAKAAKQNADLADDERALLLSLGDVFWQGLSASRLAYRPGDAPGDVITGRLLMRCEHSFRERLAGR